MALEYLSKEVVERFDNKFITIDLDEDSVKFKFQKGPIKENGVNGCQTDDAIIFVRKVIESMNSRFPCRENSLAITKLQEAEMWLKKGQNLT